MVKAYLFPGQGSQKLGMGLGLFEKYPDFTDLADQILGYSIKELCLYDKENRLNQTLYTQPSIFTVSILSYLNYCEENQTHFPEFLAGHSLGEYAALFVAGCFDFATGLRIVQERARLMNDSVDGGMAAILQIDKSKIVELLQNNSQFPDIDIANINTPMQTVISGDKDQIFDLADHVTRLGGILHPLNVSGAFHSRYMHEAQKKFNLFLHEFNFQSPNIPVIANISARPYPKENRKIADTLVKQITGSIAWQDSIYYMTESGVDEFVEMGPGTKLTVMNSQIIPTAPKPRAVAASAKPPQVLNSKHNSVIFICPGQGGQYFGMARKLYECDDCFQQHFNRCDNLARKFIGDSICSIIFEQTDNNAVFLRTLHTHIANFSLGISISLYLQEQGIEPVAYIGWSLGEYIALTLSGALKLEDTMMLVARQAILIEEETEKTSTLLIKSNVNIFYSLNKLFFKTILIGIHSHTAFVVAGTEREIDLLKHGLLNIGIESYWVPVQHGFHTKLIDSIEVPFRALCETISHCHPVVPTYSCALYNIADDINEDYLWMILRSRFNFNSTLRLVSESYPDAEYIDIGPSGTSAGFAGEILSRRDNIRHALRELR
jgi:malonyl CoA-acyl carrier protein transacylase